MEIPVLLEKVEANGYRASSLIPASLVAVGATREEALQQLAELVRAHLGRKELVGLQIAVIGEPHPWAPFAGTWKDHPDAREFEENLRDYRRQIDEDPNQP